MPSRQFYGRRLGRALKGDRELALKKLLPLFEISQESIKAPESLCPHAIRKASKTSSDIQEKEKKSNSSVFLEIGFGSGEHVLGLMKQHPKTQFLAVEPYINGMAQFLKDLADLEGLDLSQDSENIKNTQFLIQNNKGISYKNRVAVFMDDALLLCHALQSQSLDRIYILNPDPWHKTRHHKRRIINEKNLECFARLLKPKGELIVSTDVIDLANWIITKTYNHPGFSWEASSAKDWCQPPSDWISTKYESKGAKGASQMSYFKFTKNINYID